MALQPNNFDHAFTKSKGIFFMGKCVKEGIIYIYVELVKLVFLQTIKEEEREVYHPLEKVVELLNRGIK
jgi:hypothetical protein